jgi:hypothetical protein
MENNVEKIINEIKKAENVDIKFALIEYKDLPPQDSTVTTRFSKKRSN